MILTKGKTASVIYHDIFDYPLTKEELERWEIGKTILNRRLPTINLQTKDGLYFLKGKEKNIKKRLQRQKYAKKKLEIANRVGRLLSYIPSVLMIAVTGALAMKNTKKESDIDLLIVTKKGTLWSTRAIVFLIVKVLRIPLRKPDDKNERDRLCINMWLDESDVLWPQGDRNVFSAHEIGQIVPLANKNLTYEKFINTNKWIFDYWPNSVSSRQLVVGRLDQRKSELHIANYLLQVFEPIARNLQYWYMKGKMTREVVTPTRAVFHPKDQGLVVTKKLNKYGIF